MKFIRYVIPLFILSCLSSFSGSKLIAEAIIADPSIMDESATDLATVEAVLPENLPSQLKATDETALREYVKKMRAITVKEKGGNLILSGTVQLSWHHLTAENHGHSLRGFRYEKVKVAEKKNNSGEGKDKHSSAAEKSNKGGKAKDASPIANKKTEKNKWKFAGPPYGKNEFGIEANLVFEYRADRGWSTIQLQFDNAAGTKEINTSKPKVSNSHRIMFGSGQKDQISLKQAYAGYNIWSEGISRLDVEIGRRKMYSIFDSKIEFDNYFDGIYGRYTTSQEGIADFSLKAGAFVIDSTVNHYGYVGEAGILNIGDTGFDFKYSLVDWQLRKRNRYGERHPLGTRFLNSQFLCNYTVPESICSMEPRFYGAYLVNSAAKPNHWTRGKRANEAFYFGTAMGEIRKKGDWSYEILYEWVQAQAIPENDVRDAGRDNPGKFSFYNRRSGGFANYKGWKLDFFYALTDNWTIHPYFEDEHQINRSIGGRHHSTEFTIETIFAF